MKPDPTPENEESLRNLLRQWEVDSPLPPRFQAQVWRRIARADAKTDETLWARLLQFVALTLPRPRFAYSYVAALLLLGVVAGSWAAQRHTARLDASLGAHYMQSVDPYLKSVSHP